MLRYMLIILMLFMVPSSAAANELRAAVRDLMGDTHTMMIVVDNFTYADGKESWDGRVLSARVNMILSKGDIPVGVMERTWILQVYERIGLQGGETTGAAASIEMARRLGASRIVIGSLSKLPKNRVQVDMRLVEVAYEDSRPRRRLWNRLRSLENPVDRANRYRYGTVVATTSTVVRRDWANPPVLREDDGTGGPLSLAGVRPRTPRIKLPPGGASVLVVPPVPNEYDHLTGAIYIGYGCDFDIYYEGDGTFKTWSSGKPHGIGNNGYFITKERTDRCDYVQFIDKRIREKHHNLRELWENYKRDNGL